MAFNVTQHLQQTPVLVVTQFTKHRTAKRFRLEQTREPASPLIFVAEQA